MKKLEKLEKYVIIPNTRFYGGYVFDGEDINLCDDTFTDYDKIKNENGELEEKEVVNINVKQKIINSVLITDLTSFTLCDSKPDTLTICLIYTSCKANSSPIKTYRGFNFLFNISCFKSFISYVILTPYEHP